jgi:nitroreductase
MQFIAERARWPAPAYSHAEQLGRADMSNVRSINFPQRPHSGKGALMELPAPDLTRSKSIMRALQSRRSTREFSARTLSGRHLSNLLWAASGVNRPATDGRTTPSAHNWKEMLVFVSLADGWFVYDAVVHALRRKSEHDLRGATGTQAFVAVAPVNLIYVADFDAMTEAAADDERILFSAADAGFIAQSVYLYCASAGLATVVRGLIDRVTLGRTMALLANQRIILAQSVGYRLGLV